MAVQVNRVTIPAFSTIGYAYGIDTDTGEEVKFAGDHRPMRYLGEALRAGEVPEVDLEGWQVLSRTTEERG